MAEAVIAYDKDLPEIPARRPWQKPTQHLVKDDAAPTGWRVAEGRRPSKLLLVPKIRTKVDAWGEQGYPGASVVSRRLFEYWFEKDHEVPGFNVPFRYYFCQREAIETLVWLVEVAGARDVQELIQTYGTKFRRDPGRDTIAFQTTMDGRRQLRRYVPELEAEGVQDLPPEDLRRFAFKLATGSGKPWVMAMAVVWSYFHKKRMPSSELSTNFLIVAPNVIVYQRLEKDFASNRIFRELPLVPPEWRPFEPNVILRGEASESEPSGNQFGTNIHQLYESRDQEWTPQNAVDALLGKKPAEDLVASSQRPILERVKLLKDLMVINDEAHHVHDEDLAWSQSLLAIHRALPKGLALWLDFSATPKHQNGMYFPWTVCDYPLAQAVEDRIVKAPLIVSKEDDAELPTRDPHHVTKYNVVEKYGYRLRAAVARWKEHWDAYKKKLGVKPVLFIMAEKNAYADAIGEYLCKTKEFRIKESEVLVIHTDAAGEITKKNLEKAREAARDIDNNDINVIVSVMMLREGWDVRNVTVVLGLRPFAAKAEILPEQVIGRGLRMMRKVSPDRLQTLEVLGTRNLLNLLRSQLEAEGVSVTTTKIDPPTPIVIEPLQQRIEYDIGIPLTKPQLVHDFRKLSQLSVSDLEAIYEQEELAEQFRIKLKLEFATTETEVHQADITAGELPTAQDLLSSITNKVISQAKLPSRFAELYPAVRSYVAKRCFGREVDLASDPIRSHLARPEIQEGIAKYLGRKIAELTLERRAIEFERADFRLSETRPFSWRRDLPPLEAKKTIFNYVATYNKFERCFAEFLDSASDVLRFASLGTTEQGESGTQFRVDYIKPTGVIGFYHPDWVVVQTVEGSEVNWIIETKGRVWEGTGAKDEAMQVWCKRVSANTGKEWHYKRIDQSDLDAARPRRLEDLADA
ncbi:DEAD/DEAH box helicase family protein [Thermoleophilum album]|uniref:DEAD/DEAH box helicase n=1 Tax=Thermoleophilum album TaxID=29539 RepID=UPI00237CE589|nr:DEAD/DEAH box helicase family protein [Thermoleophilum album]WDT93021.1 DEAD/DEAH box helicase family protein [Thermoleophilum album]